MWLFETKKILTLMVFMAQKVKMCPPKYTKYKIDLTGQYTWKFENTPGQYGLIRDSPSSHVFGSIIIGAWKETTETAGTPCHP